MILRSINRSEYNVTKTSTFKDAVTAISYKFDSKEEFDAFASLFPKYCKIVCGGLSNDIHGNGGYKLGVHIDLTTPTNDVTGSVNETAEKRVKKIKSILATIKGA